jgi:hypothetical protein
MSREGANPMDKDLADYADGIGFFPGVQRQVPSKITSLCPVCKIREIRFLLFLGSSIACFAPSR